MKMKKKTTTATILNMGLMSGVKAIAEDYSQLGQDYIYSRMTLHSPYRPNPIKSDMMTIFLCQKGKLNITVNLNQYTITDHSLMVMPPGSIFKADSDGFEKVEGDFLFLSAEFCNDLNIDLKDVDLRLFIAERKPVLTLTEDEFQHLSRYFELIHQSTIDTTTKPFFTKVISRNLINATIYQIMQYSISRNAQELSVDKNETSAEDDKQNARRANYMYEFLKLVRANFKTERSITFYADKLFISPKYLSLLIKEATGKTAVAWINDFVIFEAKALLRFSSKNVQQIAYELNFPNQSSFGKYFKQRTGMSPSQFKSSY